MRGYSQDKRAFTLILIDLDRFKAINDTYGHSTGDDVLRKVANIITGTLPTESYINRLGGDEFAAIVPNSQMETDVWADRIRQEVQNLKIEKHPALRCDLSIGVAEAQPDLDSFRQWFDRADKAMYADKKSEHVEPNG